jgi:hypothetical protein
MLTQWCLFYFIVKKFLYRLTYDNHCIAVTISTYVQGVLGLNLSWGVIPLRFLMAFPQSLQATRIIVSYSMSLCI